MIDFDLHFELNTVTGRGKVNILIDRYSTANSSLICVLTNIRNNSV